MMMLQAIYWCAWIFFFLFIFTVWLWQARVFSTLKLMFEKVVKSHPYKLPHRLTGLCWWRHARSSLLRHFYIRHIYFWSVLGLLVKQIRTSDEPLMLAHSSAGISAGETPVFRAESTCGPYHCYILCEVVRIWDNYHKNVFSYVAAMFCWGSWWMWWKRSLLQFPKASLKSFFPN